MCFSRVGWFILYAILSVFLLFPLASENYLRAQMTSYIIKSRTGEIQFKEQLGRVKANLVLIAYASSEGSGEPAHPRSLVRTSAARSYKQ